MLITRNKNFFKNAFKMFTSKELHKYVLFYLIQNEKKKPSVKIMNQEMNILLLNEQLRNVFFYYNVK